jgi:hypothetical protein
VIGRRRTGGVAERAFGVGREGGDEFSGGAGLGEQVDGFAGPYRDRVQVAAVNSLAVGQLGKCIGREVGPARQELRDQLMRKRPHDHLRGVLR